MLEIKLNNGTVIPLRRKSILMLPAQNNITEFTNKEDDYEVIMIIGGVDRNVNIELSQPAIIIIDSGTRTTVNVTGGMALPLSQVVFINGVDNILNGLTTQNKGRIISAHKVDFDLGAVACFEKIHFQ